MRSGCYIAELMRIKFGLGRGLGVISYFFIFAIFATAFSPKSVAQENSNSTGDTPSGKESHPLGNLPDFHEAINTSPMGDSNPEVTSLTKPDASGNKACIIPTACGILIMKMAITAVAIKPQTPERDALLQQYIETSPENPSVQAAQDLGYPDWTFQRREVVEHAREFHSALWAKMYGPRYETASPPNPSTPSEEMKSRMLITRAHSLSVQPIPQGLRKLLYGEKAAQREELIEAGARLQLYKQEYEKKFNEPYHPESVVLLGQAFNEVRGNSAMSGTAGILRPFFTIIEKSLNDDYAVTLNEQAELDIYQNKLFYALASAVLEDKVKLVTPVSEEQKFRDIQTGAAHAYPNVNDGVYRVIQTLDAYTISNRTNPLPEDIVTELFKLLEPNDDRLPLAVKTVVARIFNDMLECEGRLVAARERWGRSYPAQVAALMLVSGYGHSDGFTEDEYSNFLRQSWIQDLNTKHRLWVQLGAQLLCRKQILMTNIDEWLDLKCLSPNQIIRKYIDDVRMHDPVMNLVLRKEYMDTDFALGAALYEMVAQTEAIRARLGARQAAIVEAKYKRGAQSLVGDLNKIPGAAQSMPVRGFEFLVGLIDDDGSSDALKGKTTSGSGLPRVRPLSEKLPQAIAERLAAFLANEAKYKEVHRSEVIEWAERDLKLAELKFRFNPDDADLKIALAKAQHDLEKAKIKYAPLPEVPTAPTTVAAGSPPVAVKPRTLYEELYELDSLARRIFNGQVITEREQTTDQEPLPNQTAEVKKIYKIYNREIQALMRRTLTVLLAMESVMAQDDGVPFTRSVADAEAGKPTPPTYDFAARDAAITLVHHMMSEAPTLARLIDMYSEMPVLNGLRVWILVGRLQQLAGRAQDLRDGFDNQTTLWGSTVDFVNRTWEASKSKKWLWATVAAGAIGLSSWLLYHTADTWTHYVPFLNNRPAVTQPVDIKPQPPASVTYPVGAGSGVEPAKTAR